MKRSNLWWMGLVTMSVTLPAVVGAGSEARERWAAHDLQRMEGPATPAPVRSVECGLSVQVDAAARTSSAQFSGNTLPDADAAIARAHRESDGRPESAVWRLIGAFERMDVEGYLSALTEDFRFDSDDPDFHAALPEGFDRAGERKFLTHLFQGGGHAPDGTALPIATRVDETLGPMRVTVDRSGGRRAIARMEHVRVRLTFADGSTAELGDTDNDVELVLGEAGWRIRRWRESQASGEPDAGVANAVTSERPGAGTDVPARLALAARNEPGARVVRFDLALPVAGGALELFDVMGRRLTERDLTAFAPGRHVVTLDAIAIPAGIYWARVRQGGDAVSVRLVWIR